MLPIHIVPPIDIMPVISPMPPVSGGDMGFGSSHVTPQDVGPTSRLPGTPVPVSGELDLERTVTSSPADVMNTATTGSTVVDAGTEAVGNSNLVPGSQAVAAVNDASSDAQFTNQFVASRNTPMTMGNATPDLDDRGNFDMGASMRQLATDAGRSRDIDVTSRTTSDAPRSLTPATNAPLGLTYGLPSGDAFTGRLAPATSTNLPDRSTTTGVSPILAQLAEKGTTGTSDASPVNAPVPTGSADVRRDVEPIRATGVNVEQRLRRLDLVPPTRDVNSDGPSSRRESVPSLIPIINGRDKAVDEVLGARWPTPAELAAAAEAQPDAAARAEVGADRYLLGLALAGLFYAPRKDRASADDDRKLVAALPPRRDGQK
jgi:hypothetical protein